MTFESPQTGLSVIVCTHNRATLTIECVESLLNCPQARSLDIIVVDNASSPEHHALLASRLTSPLVRFVKEPRPGVSLARNLGASLANHEWLAYLDDDALPFPDWAARALELAKCTGPTVGLIGGAVLPRWPNTNTADTINPDRLGLRWRNLLSLVDSERKARGSRVPEVVACNMLVRRSVLERVGLFPVELGRTPKSLLGGEEIIVARRVVACDFAVQFDEKLRVYHQIHPERLGTRWVRRRAEAEGELLWRFSPSLATTAKVVLSIPYLALAARLREAAPTKPKDYDYHVRLWNNLGFLKSAMSSMVQRSRNPA